MRMSKGAVVRTVVLAVGFGLGLSFRPAVEWLRAAPPKEEARAVAPAEKTVPSPPTPPTKWVPFKPMPKPEPPNTVLVKAVGGDREVILSFVPVVAEEALEAKHLTFEPAVENVRIARLWDGTFSLEGDFEPETDYTVTVPAGVRNCRGGVSAEAQTLAFRTKPYAEELRFLTSGTYLPSHRAELPYEATNVKEVRFTLSRAYENNLTPFGFGGWEADRLMMEVTNVTVRLEAPRNMRANHRLGLAELTGGRPGVYRVEAEWEHPSQRNARGHAERYLVLTDLGVAYAYDGDGGFRVAVHRFSDGTPVADAEVTAMDGRHQPAARGRTGADGVATLAPLSTGDASACAKVLVRAGNDLGYLDLEETNHWRTPPVYWSPREPRAFLWADRGAVRPGETVRVYALVRDPDLRPMAEVPFALSLSDPQGTKLGEQCRTTDAFGLLWADFTVPDATRSGTHWATLLLGESHVGDVRFYVSDFVPDRLELSLAFREGEDAVQLEAKTYFGTVAEKARGRLGVSYAEAPLPEAWRGWTVGGGALSGRLSDVRFVTEARPSRFRFELPKRRFSAPLLLRAEVSVAEQEGHAVTTVAFSRRFTEPAYVGLREEDGRPEATLLVPEGSETREATAEVALERLWWEPALTLGPDGTYRHAWHERAESLPLKERALRLRAGEAAVPDLGDALRGGRYRLTLTLAKEVATALEFWHDAGEAGWRSSNPAVLTFRTDRERYRPGDEAILSFSVPTKGTLFVAEGECGLSGFWTRPLGPGAQNLKVRIPETVRTGSWHVGVTFVPSGPEAVGRSFGHAALKVDQAPTFGLKVALEAPEVARPGTGAEVTVRLSTPEGAPCGGEVALFAVDEGVLSLTDFQTPDPFGAFFGPHGGRFACGDVYGLLYPHLRIGPEGKIGGGTAALRPGTLRYEQVARVALPPLRVPDSGLLTVRLPMPEAFQGTLRLMAVAATSGQGRVGAGDRRMVVRPATTLQVSGVRFGCPGDEANVSMTATNHDLPDGPFSLTLNGREVVAGTLAQGATTNVVCRLPVGDAVATLRMGEGQVTVRQPVAVRPPVPTVRATTFAWLPEGAALPEGATRVNTFGEALGEPLDWLVAYPYDCTEQLSSKALPYGFRRDARSKAILAEAVRTLLPRLSAREGFRMWTSGETFVSEASLLASGVTLAAFSTGALPKDEAVRQRLLGFLRAKAGDLSAEARSRAAYAAWLLAQEGDPAFLAAARNLLAANASDSAAYVAAAASAKGGHAGEGAPHMRAFLASETDPKPLFDRYMDASAALGMTLTLAIECGLADAIPPERLAALLACPKRTTQSNAWAAAALGALEARRVEGTLIRRTERVPAVRPHQLIQVHREVVDAEGRPVTSLPHGELAYLRLRLTLPKAVESLAVRDLLPGGLAYEDAALATRASRELPKWAQKLPLFQADYTQKTGDEVRFFGSAREGVQWVVYPVRAVTRGTFRMPATVAEAMYDPDLTGGYAPETTFAVE